MWIDRKSCEDKLYRSIAAELKPYFFIYRYSYLKNKYDKYNLHINSNCKIRFGCSLKDLKLKHTDLTDEEREFLDNCNIYMPINMAPGVMNRICWKIEDAFTSTDVFPNVQFDYSILKSNDNYTEEEFDQIQCLYNEYNTKMQLILKRQKKNEEADENIGLAVDQLKSVFIDECNKICPNSFVLANIVVDLCYTSNKNKTFAWDVAGEQIFRNVLKNNNNRMLFPVKSVSGDIEFAGDMFAVHEKIVGGVNDVDFE